MKFRYKKYGPYLRPVIPLKLKYRGITQPYNALVDSGSDECLFDSQVAGLLGIEVEQGEMRKASGVGGQTVIYFVHPVEIEIGGFLYETKVGFVSRAGGPFEYGALGQKGFFDVFVVKFDLLKEEIELRKRD